MFVAKNQLHNRVVLGTEFKENRQYARWEPYCPICGKQLAYNHSAQHPFEYFAHRDGTPDCFANDSATERHRLPVEVGLKKIHNRLQEVAGGEIDIDVERRIGTKSNFKIADIRVTSPLKIAAEIYYGAKNLDLIRRLQTMFNHGYRAYVIFHLEGYHDVTEIEQMLQQLAPLRIGRFDPDCMELSLGDLFSRDRITFDKATRDSLPNYMV